MNTLTENELGEINGGVIPVGPSGGNGAYNSPFAEWLHYLFVNGLL